MLKRFVPTKPKNFRDFCILGFFKLRSRGYIPAGNYMFKVNYKSTRTKHEICSEVTIKTPERRPIPP